VQEEDPPVNALDVVDREHRALLALALGVEAGASAAARGRTLVRFRDELLLHTVLEEATLYAELELLNDPGVSATLEVAFAENDEMERLLSGLGRWSPGGPGFGARFRTASDLFVRHVVRHEATLRRAASARLYAGTLRDLAGEMDRLRSGMHAPLHPGAWSEARDERFPVAVREGTSAGCLGRRYDEARAAARRGEPERAAALLVAALRPDARTVPFAAPA
jgi:hypothetical protein